MSKRDPRKAGFALVGVLLFLLVVSAIVAPFAVTAQTREAIDLTQGCQAVFAPSEVSVSSSPSAEACCFSASSLNRR